jgi:hypothetical protein
MDERGLVQGGFELILDGSQVGVALLDEAGHAPCRQLDPQQVLEQLTGASVGHGLSFNQIHGQGGNASAILGWRLDLCGKTGSRRMSTSRTALFLHTMLLDPERFRWQISDLPAFRVGGWLLAQIVLALLTDLDWINEHFIGQFNLLEVMPLMTVLSTWLFATFLAQTLGRAHETIQGGRQATVMAVFGFLLLQFFYPSLQEVDRHQRLFQSFTQRLILLSQLLDLFIFAHTCSVVILGFSWQLGNPLLNSYIAGSFLPSWKLRLSLYTF